MVFDRDSHEKLETKLISQYKSIFDELTAIFDRFDVSGVDELPDNFIDIDINIKIVTKIITSYWNLPLDLVFSDFETELNRKNKNQMPIPDVPTYQIRFALEEGSWIILLRNEFPKMLRPHLSRLITLEDTIFKTGKAIDDDCAYYLIELDIISRNWIKPLVQYWKNEHDFSKNTDLAIRVISAIFNTQDERGNELFAGSRRLMQSKMGVLERVHQIRTSSNWALNARSIYDTLVRQFDENKYEDDVVNMFLTLSALQKEMIRFSTKTDESDQQEILQYSIVRKIGWEELEIDDSDSLEYFSDALLIVLYDLPFDNPSLAAQKLLDQFSNEIQLPQQLTKKFKDLLNTELENRTSQIIELEERDRLAVTVIEEFLPSLFVQIKQGISEGNLASILSNPEHTSKSSQWENFDAQLSRIKRINDLDVAKSSFNKVLRSTYNLLIQENIPPYGSVELICNNFITIHEIKDFKLESFLEKAKIIIDNGINEDLSLVIVDQSLVDLLFNELNPYII